MLEPVSFNLIKLTFPDKMKLFIKGLFEKKKDSDKKKPAKPKYKKEEIDFGRFHQTLAWDSDNNRLAYAKYRYGKHGSFLWDIRVYNQEEKQAVWITENKRAAYPVWDKNEMGLYFQTKTIPKRNDKWEIITAARFDHHDQSSIAIICCPNILI